MHASAPRSCCRRPFCGDRSLAGILRLVTLPTLHVTATGHGIKIPGYYSTAGGAAPRLRVSP